MKKAKIWFGFSLALWILSAVVAATSYFNVYMIYTAPVLFQMLLVPFAGFILLLRKKPFASVAAFFALVSKPLLLLVSLSILYTGVNFIVQSREIRAQTENMAVEQTAPMPAEARLLCGHLLPFAAIPAVAFSAAVRQEKAEEQKRISASAER